MASSSSVIMDIVVRTEKLEARLRQLNDTLYELYKPPGQPGMQILFFHGLGDDQNAHLSTWTSRDGSTIWPQTWLVEEFPYAQVMTVSYGPSLSSTSTSRGGIDMYLLAENMISDLISAGVGQDPGVPLILVGHSFGGLAIREICLQAFSRAKKSQLTSLGDQYAHFLNSVKGFFFYATPSRGFSNVEVITSFVSKGPLQEFVKVLNKDATRKSSEFDHLRKRYKWRTGALGEALPTKYGRSRAFMVVAEASARYRVDAFYVPADTDHITVCKPESKLSSAFYFLTRFLADVVEVQVQENNFVEIHQVYGMPEYGAGLEKRVHDIQRMLTNVAIIGVVGMGGIGKTTIAKLLFNQISKDFEYTNFVENVNSISGDTLEDSILSNFYYQGRKVHPNESTQWYDLKEKKTLIVMDDVRLSEQLLTIPSLNHFGSGSCLIITSRDRGLFNIYSYKLYLLYDVDFLEDDESMKLFCYHAFDQESIPEDLMVRHHYLEEYVERIVRKCQGLPLTIEVMGRYLRGHSTPSMWEETIRKLGEAQSIDGSVNDRVWSSLRVSYDSLLPEDRKLFVDAATYFYEQPVDQALAVWDSIYGSSSVRWKRLLDKGMVQEVDRSTRDFSGGRETQYVAVSMQQQLRDLAKALSRNRSNNVNWLRANPSILQLPSGDQKYATASDRIQMVLPSDLLDTYSESLRYLDLDGVMIEGLLKTFPRKLLLLRWKMRSMSQLPPIAFEDMEDLVMLELANWEVPKKFAEGLGNLINLRTLHLSQLEGLNSLPTNFGNLSRLNRLQLVDLGLLMLPDSFGNLGALEYLTLVDVKILSLPQSFGKLFSLRELSLHGCTQLERLPESLCHLSALQRLTIEDADHLEVLPDRLGMLCSLEHLTLASVSISAFPESFGQLSSLRELVVRDCTQLETLPESLGQLSALQRLTIEKADHLEVLPESLGMLFLLEYLTLEHLLRRPR